MTLPEPIRPLRPKDVAAIRRALNVSQSVFAALLSVRAKINSGLLSER
jgi:DNA-binding transcriptional regulator YiaG